jgi:hypothetical protein
MLGQGLRDKLISRLENGRDEHYLVAFGGGFYIHVIDRAKYGLGGTAIRVKQIFPSMVGMIYATEPMASRRAYRTVDITWFP